MRNAFAEEIIRLILKDKRIILLMGDTGAGLFDELFEKVPEQIINTGIAEANMVTISAGLAKSGYIPFVYSIGAHLVYRAYEQIRNDICLNNANVKLVSVGSGLHYADHGPTHHALEDFAVMKSLPNIKIISPSGKFESKLFTKLALETPGPIYIRLGRGKDTINDYNPVIGKGVKITDGSDITIITTGSFVYDVYNLIEYFSEINISVSLININTIKPLDDIIIKEAAKETKSILVIEEHQEIGGLAESVSSVLVKNGLNIKFDQIGIKDNFCSYIGSYEGIKENYGLSKKAIITKVQNLINS